MTRYTMVSPSYFLLLIVNASTNESDVCRPKMWMSLSLWYICNIVAQIECLYHEYFQILQNYVCCIIYLYNYVSPEKINFSYAVRNF